jgi:hypothetical protein
MVASSRTTVAKTARLVNVYANVEAHHLRHVQEEVTEHGTGRSRSDHGDTGTVLQAHWIHTFSCGFSASEEFQSLFHFPATRRSFAARLSWFLVRRQPVRQIADAVRHCLHDAIRQRRILVNAAEEVLFVDRQNATWLDRADCGRPNLLFEERHFTEEFVRSHLSEPEFLAVRLDQSFDLAILDDEHAVALVPLPEDHLARFIFFSEASHIGDPFYFTDSYFLNGIRFLRSRMSVFAEAPPRSVRIRCSCRNFMQKLACFMGANCTFVRRYRLLID